MREFLLLTRENPPRRAPKRKRKKTKAKAKKRRRPKARSKTMRKARKRKKRKRRKRRRNAVARRRPKRRRKTRKRRRRPAARKRKTRKRRRPRARKRRRRYRLKKTGPRAGRRAVRRRGRRNPVRRRYVGGSPKKKYRKRNPGLRGYTRGFTRRLTSFFSVPVLVNGLQGVAGFGLALYLPTLATSWLPIPRRFNRGWAGVGLSAVSTALASGLCASFISKKCGKAVFVGGLIATSLRALMQIAPRQVKQWIPLGEIGGSSYSTRLRPGPLDGLDNYLTLPGGGGVGDYLSYPPVSSGLPATTWGQPKERF